MHYVKGKKPDSKGCRLDDSIYVTFGQKQTIGLKNRLEDMRLRVEEHFGEMEMFYNFFVVKTSLCLSKPREELHTKKCGFHFICYTSINLNV